VGHTSFQFNRRSFLQAGLLAAGAAAFDPAFFKRAFAAGPVTVGDGPYGPLRPFDSNGIALPHGFRSREIARGASPVPGSFPPYIWHNATDGQATFPTLGPGGKPDGGWILVANSEMPVPGTGGVSAVEFACDGKVERAYRVLLGTTANCAGGPAPWGRWLSCEEHDNGQVWECDPSGASLPLPRPALGVFKHEAVCVDPTRHRLYLTEDQPDGCLYRFTPTVYPDLSAGLLEVALVDALGKVSWQAVPNPSGGLLAPTRNQVSGAARFDGGEGTWYHQGVVYFTTKGDNRLWAYHVGPSKLEVIYDAAAVGANAPLSGVDNVTVSPAGDIYVCEDGSDHDICLITPDFEVSRFLKLHPEVHSGPPEGSPFEDNETVGVVFDPSGTRMYFGAQRSFAIGGLSQLPAGVVYEICGPFRRLPSAGGRRRVRARAKPGLELRAPRRMPMRRFMRHGLPVKLLLDEPTGIEATLHVAARGPDGERRSRTIARAAPEVAVLDDVALRLEPKRNAARLLDGNDEVAAHLKVVASGADGKRAVLRRAVKLARPSHH
jgi:Bacterial protein of unknown function (DUF839)